MTKTIKDISLEIDSLKEKIELIKEIEKIKSQLEVTNKRIGKIEILIDKLWFWILIGAIAIWIALTTGLLSALCK